MMALYMWLFREQTKGKIYGWQSTQCAKNRSFKQVSAFQPFIQVLHVTNCHWVVAPNADPKRTGGYHTKAVGYNDSSHPLNVSIKMRETCFSNVKLPPFILTLLM